MEQVLNSIGGYDGWQLTTIAFGFLAVGLGLRIKWWFLFPIPAFGVFLMYLRLNHAYDIAAPNIANPMTSGIASTLPILFVAISIFILLDPSVVARMFGSHHQGGK